MSLSLYARSAFVGCALVLTPGVTFGQASYETNGAEYAIAGTLPGDQLHPQAAVVPTGGFLVWQDNVTDGDGLGISAQRLDSGFSAVFAPFRVNATAAGDQENPQISLLPSGGAAFAWQSGPQGFQHIYARFLSNSNTWQTANDVLVNSANAQGQLDPAITTLANGNVVVIYSSINQRDTNSLQDVYGQLFSPTGQKIGAEFAVNQFSAYNQRSASVAPLKNGGFVVVWVSEQQRMAVADSGSSESVYAYAQSAPNNQVSVDVYARLYSASGAPVSTEFLVNSTMDLCANPRVAAGSDGGFMVTWGQKNVALRQYSWDIYARPFSATGMGGQATLVNTYQYGDQYLPRISALGTDYLVVWTSLGQDGSREGVFGQFLQGNGSLLGHEFAVNTTTISQQKQPAVASDGTGRFLVTWTSFVGGNGSFDLFAQRYVNVAVPLAAMNPPFVRVPFDIVNEVYQPRIQVSWPFQAGLQIDHYEVYVDGAATPAASLSTNAWVMSNLSAGSTHTFAVAYVTIDGRHSPISESTSGTAWSGYSWGGIPFEWISGYYGGPANMAGWPAAAAPLVPGGPTLLNIFLSGGNPLDPASWLKTQLVGSPQGLFLTWNPQPGRIYQVQGSADLSNWTNAGPTRFAAGTTDSQFVGGQSLAYYRVLVLR